MRSLPIDIQYNGKADADQRKSVLEVVVPFFTIVMLMYLFQKYFVVIMMGMKLMGSGSMSNQTKQFRMTR